MEKLHIFANNINNDFFVNSVRTKSGFWTKIEIIDAFMGIFFSSQGGKTCIFSRLSFIEEKQQIFLLSIKTLGKYLWKKFCFKNRAISDHWSLSKHRQTSQTNVSVLKTKTQWELISFPYSIQLQDYIFVKKEKFSFPRASILKSFSNLFLVVNFGNKLFWRHLTISNKRALKTLKEQYFSSFFILFLTQNV